MCLAALGPGFRWVVLANFEFIGKEDKSGTQSAQREDAEFAEERLEVDHW
jgi:hypothetical protein